MKNDFSRDIRILDSGASCHYCRFVEGLTDIKEIDESLKIGNGNSMKGTKIGNFKGEVTQIDGEKFSVRLNDVKNVPNPCVNLFSLNKALKKGFKVSNDAVVISLNYKHVKLTFDLVTGGLKSADLPMHQSAMKEFMISTIYTIYLDIAVMRHSMLQSTCMDLSLPEILKHMNNVLFTEKREQELVKFK
jgi:hypothetical protein